MDTGTIIVAAILVALVLLPFIFTGKNYRRQKRQLVTALKGLAEQNGVKLSTHEEGGSFGIGLDQETRFLFFVRTVNDQISVHAVHLAEMSRCKVKTTSRLPEQGEKVIDRIELVLYPNSSAQPEIVLEMYNSDYDTLTIRGELQTAVRWEQITGNTIKEAKMGMQKQTSSKQAVRA